MSVCVCVCVCVCVYGGSMVGKYCPEKYWAYNFSWGICVWIWKTAYREVGKMARGGDSQELDDRTKTI